MFSLSCKKLFRGGYQVDELMSAHTSASSVRTCHSQLTLSDETCCRLLYEAAAANDIKQFTSLLDEGPGRLNQKDENGWTLLHHASHNAATDVLSVLLQRKAKINAVNKKVETALHTAVRAGHTVVAELLVHHGIDATIKNKDKVTAVHLAVQLRKHDVLEAMLKSKKVDSQVEGEFNMTPLHLAAIIDDDIAAKIIINQGAMMCRPCALGRTVLHHAAENASKKVINLVLEIAEAKGYTREFLLSREDKYKHSPLHLAINSGNTEPVKVVLEAGAHIDCKQEDGSTALHLVCSQPGSLETVKVMWQAQPARFKTCLNSGDASEMTPLHRAAMFDFSDVAEFLIQQGAPLDARDCNGRTPLLLSASRQCWAAVKVLYAAGSDPYARDNEKANFLHLSIKTGTDLGELWKCRKGSNMCPKLLNETDVFGCTPLHYASKIGNMPSIVGLLSQGAHITIKDNSKQSPLHFASKNGRSNCCVMLLDSVYGSYVVNSADGNGRTALHLAAMCGHVKVVAILLQGGALPNRYGRVNTCRALLDSLHGSFVINEVNGEGKTPLHLASENGHIKIVALLMQRGALLHRDHGGNSPLHLAAKHSYTQTMKLLLNVHPALLNGENNEGNTPLHEAAIANKPKSLDLLLNSGGQVTENLEGRTFLDIAIERCHQEACQATISNNRWKEILLMPTHVHGSYLIGMVKYLPDMAIASLDRCTETSEHDPISSDYSVTYHFDLIRTDSSTIPTKKQLRTADGRMEKLNEARIPMAALTSMVKHERVECLSHPVCLKFLKMKWSTVGIWFQTLNLLIYGLYLACLTSSIILIGPQPIPMNISSNDTEIVAKYQKIAEEFKTSYNLYLPLIMIVLVFVGLNVLKEFMQMVQLKWRYFMEMTNYIEWLLYICSALYAGSMLIGEYRTWIYNCGVTSLFFSWINLLLILQRFEFFGTYVVMFKEILATLVRVLIVFSIVIFAFGVTFFALLRYEADNGYTSLPLSVLSSVVMMVGDMNYMDTFVRPSVDQDPRTLTFSGLAFFIYSLFILLIPILLMNLLIGLAVGDIEGVQKNARLKRLAMQVQLTADMEKKVPKFLIRKVNKQSLEEFPNRPCAAISKWYDGWVTGSDKQDSQSAETEELRSQLMQQKSRLKAIQADMKTQTELLKLVIAKMDIKTESSSLDEGCQDEEMDLAIILKQAASKTNHWKQGAGDVVKQSQVVSRWQTEQGESFKGDVCAPVRKVSVAPAKSDQVETNI